MDTMEPSEVHGVFDELKDTEPSDSAPEEDKVTVLEQLSIYFMLMLLGLGSLVAFINLEGEPHGIQIATMLSYSGAVFIWTFFRTRGVNTRHPLSEPYVQEQLPKLLGIHGLFLLTVYGFEAAAFALAPRLSSWWFTASDSKDMPPFHIAIIVFIGALCISQVVLSRRILYRAKQHEELLQNGG